MEIKDDDSGSSNLFDGILPPRLGRLHSSAPSVIVIGGGISGIAAARFLHNASFKVLLLESRDRLGGRIHTDYSFGCPVDMGASWLHGVCDENPLAPLIRRLGLTLYRTSGDNSVLYDHDLESYMLFDMDGHQVPQNTVVQVGEVFKKILSETEKVRNEHSHDLSVLQAISIVLDRHPELRQEGLSHEVLQWYICRMEAWFAADADTISLKTWDQEQVLTGGHGLMVQGYNPVIKALSKDIDIRLNHRVKRITNGYNKVMVTVKDGRNFIADAAIITVPLGVLKANLIEFEPKLPEWKQSAIADLGVGNENKIALRFDNVFWPNVELLGVVAPTSYACGYFLNLHKATGHRVLVYMAAGRLACDLEKLTDESAAEFAMLQLKKMFPDATKPVLLGDMGAGKSSLVIRFIKGQFLEFQESTIGAAFFSSTLAVNNATVKFEIWDTAGQERYHSLAPMYYRGAAAAIIVYDITSSDSFAKAKKWVQELQKQGNSNMIMALAGNKADLEDRRNVPAEEARLYAEENGLFFMETSAKTAANVNDIFYEIAKRLPTAQPTQNPAGMVLENRPAEGSRTASCCT